MTSAARTAGNQTIPAPAVDGLPPGRAGMPPANRRGLSGLLDRAGGRDRRGRHPVRDAGGSAGLLRLGPAVGLLHVGPHRILLGLDLLLAGLHLAGRLGRVAAAAGQRQAAQDDPGPESQGRFKNNVQPLWGILVGASIELATKRLFSGQRLPFHRTF